MSKRANGEGCITKRGNSFRVTYPSDDGKRIQKQFKTQKEAALFLMRINSDKIRGEYVEPNELTVSAWLKQWLADFAPLGWKHAKTKDVFGTYFNLHIIPYWESKGVPLQKLTPSMCQIYVNHWINMEYATATVLKFAKLFSTAIAQAVINELIVKNPCSNWKLPKFSQKDIKFLTKEQQDALKSVLPDTTTARAIKFFMLTGLRASELIALQWHDVRADGLHIERAAHNIKNNWHIEPPKSEKSRRVVPLCRTARALLDEQRAAQEQDYETNRAEWVGESAGHDKQWIFNNSIGGITDKAVIDRAYNTYLRRCGVAEQREVISVLPKWKQLRVKPNKEYKAGMNKIVNHPNGSKRMRIMLPDGTRKAVYGQDSEEIRRKVAAIEEAVNNGTYKKQAKENGLQYEHWGLHTLRHTFATSMNQATTDTKTLSVILGHANVSVTLSLYVHTDNVIMQEAIERLEAAYW